MILNLQPVRPMPHSFSKYPSVPTHPAPTGGPARRRLILVGMTVLLTACQAGTLTNPFSGDTGVAIAAGAALKPGQPLPVIVFVHGNGDAASIWQTSLWRFESNGWPRDRLHAIDMPLPLARNDDARPQPGRSGTEDQLRELSARVDQVRKATGVDKVVLIGNSRGGYAIRNYIRNGGGTATVAAAILGGVPNHGVWAGSFNPGSEFNGSGPFLRALNSPQGPEGLEVTPGVPVLTLRSDNNDKYAQPLGTWLGQPTMQTGVTYEGPALKGATNVVLPGRDHREVSFHAQAFEQSWRFLTGTAPKRLDFAPEPRIVLNGKVASLHEQGGTAGEPSNLPMPGATVSVYEVDPATGVRKGPAVHRRTVAADGLWGPFEARPQAPYEFVIEAPGFAVTHIYRSAFPRSSGVVHLRPARVQPGDREAQAIVTMSRPRGYFGLGRDTMSMDGLSPPPGVGPGVAGVSSAKLRIGDSAMRPIVAAFNSERIVVQSWPLSGNHLVIAEFTD